MVTYQHGDTNQNTNFSVLLSLRFIDVSSICQGDRHRSTDQTIEEVECTVRPEGEPEQKFQDAADHSSVRQKRMQGFLPTLSDALPMIIEAIATPRRADIGTM